MARNMYLNMGYTSMWSLLDSVATDELKAEIPLLESKLSDANKQATEISNTRQQLDARIRVLREVIDNRYKKELHDNFMLFDDHKMLLKAIHWNSDNPYRTLNIDDVVSILKWEKPNDEPSDKQVEEARKLLNELPIALDHIFKADIK